MPDSHYTDDPVPTWTYHINGQGESHRGFSKGCLLCKNARRARANHKKGVAKRVAKAKSIRTIIVKCVICSKEIQSSSTGLCAECYKDVRYVAIQNYGAPSKEPAKVCKNRGCDCEIKAGNKSGYCGNCYNNVTKWLNYLKKGVSLSAFGVHNS